MSAPRQGAEEDWELRPPQGRREGSSFTSLHPLPAPSILFHRNRSARQKSCHFLAALAERSELATEVGGSRARFPGPAAAWQRCSPCSTRRTHFPRWLGSAAESVGISGEGGREEATSLSRRKPLHCEGRPAPLSPVIVEEICTALEKSRPPPTQWSTPSQPIAAGKKKCLKRQRGVIQVYGLAREKVVHNVSLPTRLPEVCKILVRRRRVE